MNDVCVRGGRVATPAGMIDADIGVQGGTIREIGREVRAYRDVDASGMVVLPGMIDTHVHIRGGEFSYREDFSSGTLAAAAGGVTTILEMPVARPPASTPEAFEKRRLEVEKEAAVDIALYGGAGGDNIDMIAPLAEVGAVAFKTFMMPPPEGRESEFYGLCSEDGETLKRVMKAVAKTSLPLAVHAEDSAIIMPLAHELSASVKNSLSEWEKSRPVSAETEAIREVISSAEETGCRTIVCHVSTPEGLEMIGRAKAGGVEIYAESCPHYLLMDYDIVADAGVFARVKPPLRPPHVRKGMLAGNWADSVDFVGSDHAPYTKAEKERGGGVWKTVDGMPSLEFSLLMLLNLVSEGSLSYDGLSRITAANAAKVFHLRQKGAVAEGFDADLTLVRPCVPWKAELARMRTKSRESAALFERFEFTHRIEDTISRGRIAHSIRGVPMPCGGKFIKPTLRAT